MSDALILLVAPIWAFWIGRRLIEFYGVRGAVKANYRGKKISPALGPALLLGYLPVAAVSIWTGGEVILWLSAGTVALGVSLFGLWDDLIEDRTSGFKGHFGAGLRGKMTSGLLKVITAVPVAAIFTGSLPLPPLQRLTALLLILLSANGLNLLDRRPGRSIKAFFLAALVILIFADPFSGAVVLLLPLLAVTLAVAPLDLNAESMLGDCGANLLGAVLAVAAVLYLPSTGQLVLLFIWATVHLVSEYRSISGLIEDNPILHYLDSLGRSREKLP